MAWIHTRAGTIALITMVFAGFFFAAGKQASAGTSAAQGAAARQLLLELSESMETRVVVRCVTQKALGDDGEGQAFGSTWVGGSVISLSTRYVCAPLARMSPSSPTIRDTELDAVVTVAHEWFHTRGVADERVTECYAVRLTWEWIQRVSSYTPRARAAAKRHLLDNSLRPPAYKLASSCTLA